MSYFDNLENNLYQYSVSTRIISSCGNSVSYHVSCAILHSVILTNRYIYVQTYPVNYAWDSFLCASSL